MKHGFHVPVLALLLSGLSTSCTNQGGVIDTRELIVIGTEYAFEAPETVGSGVVTVQLVNEGATDLHNAAL